MFKIGDKIDFGYGEKTIIEIRPHQDIKSAVYYVLDDGSIHRDIRLEGDIRRFKESTARQQQAPTPPWKERIDELYADNKTPAMEDVVAALTAALEELGYDYFGLANEIYFLVAGALIPGNDISVCETCDMIVDAMKNNKPKE